MCHALNWLDWAKLYPIEFEWIRGSGRIMMMYHVIPGVLKVKLVMLFIEICSETLQEALLRTSV